MRILLTNDDGIEAAGIEALVRVLSPHHTVVVAAPAFEQSGMSHAITVKKCIRLLVELLFFQNCCRIVEGFLSIIDLNIAFLR